MIEKYQAQLLDEKRQLDERLPKLGAFMASDAFRALDAEDRWLLVDQEGAMRALGDVLQRRIDRFQKATA